MFIWDKETLNDKQENAIYEKDSLLLIACPGSGKTRTLTYKITYELSRLVSKKEFIIAITYTNIAADEIKERVELLGVDISQLWIGTIHAFCLEWILRPYALYSDELKNGFSIINSHDSQELITSLCVPYKNPKITYWDCGFNATSTGYELTTSKVHLQTNISTILIEYFKILSENKQIDFEQILHHTYQLLLAKPMICSILANLFPFILIDEFQDTKEIQYNIIAAILKANKGESKVLIVGDPNQSIFETLGGYPMPKDELETLMGFSLVEHNLSGNYRSSTKIINYFNHYRTYPNQIIPVGVDKDYDSLISFNNQVSKDDLVDELVRLILFNIEQKGISQNQICIVAPQWVHIASITRKLMIKLPNYSFNGPGMAPFARDIDNFWYKLSRIVLTEPSPSLYVRRLRWSREVLQELNIAGLDTTEQTTKYFLKLCNSIHIEETEGLAFLESFFNTICHHLKIDLALFPTLENHYQSFFNSSKKRIKRLQKEGNSFIGNIESFRKVFKQNKGVNVSTIHGVKGEEYDTMIGFGLLQDYVPHFNDTNGTENAKKLLYVICSRAKKNLHIIAERGRKKPYGNPPAEYRTTELLRLYDYSYDDI